MFGVMDTVDGKIEPSTAFYVENLDDRFRRVPKDYINHWASGHKCEIEGCMDDGSVVCHVPDYPDTGKEVYDNTGIEVLEHLCCEHAFKAGYCIVCGEFWGGIEDFDFGNGLCDNCQDACDLEDGEPDEDDPYY